MTKFHQPECENAETHRCRCWCNGEFHGIKTGVAAIINGKKIEQKQIEAKVEHIDTWIAFTGCDCKYCKKASRGTRKIMSDINKVLSK